MDHGPVVVESNPLRCSKTGVLRKANLDGVVDRIDQKHGKANDPRTYEEKAFKEAASLAPCQTPARDRRKCCGRGCHRITLTTDYGVSLSIRVRAGQLPSPLLHNASAHCSGQKPLSFALTVSLTAASASA